MNCRGCDSNNIYEEEERICGDCGLVQSSIMSDYFFEKKNSDFTGKTNKCSQWNSYTNNEKSDYKLNKYTEQICIKLNIPDNLIMSICNIVVYVMNCIKKNDSTKRSNVKDGIIVVCIQYTSRINSYYRSQTEFAKQLELDVKYITRAEKLISELIHSGKLKLDGFDKINIINPYEYINSIIKHNNIKVSENVLKMTRELIDKCNTDKILTNFSPVSIGTCCFYYILYKNNINVNLKNFAKVFNISVITITKTNKFLSESNVI